MNTQDRYSVIRWERIRRERRLPMAGDILVEQGEKVSPDTVVARSEFIPGDPYVIDLKSELKIKNVPIEQMQKVIQVKMGERIREGDPVARISGGIFGGSQVAESPVSGVVEYISAVHGRLLVREDAQSADPVVVVNVARQLDIWPAMLRMYMEYREGQEVKQGAILAASPGAGGMDYAYAPASGTIQRVDIHNGLVYIVRPQQVSSLTAYVSGEVEEIIGEEGVVIRGTGIIINGVFGIGGETHGELRIVDTGDRAVAPEDIEAAFGDKVLVIPGIVDDKVLIRADELGVRGLVVGGVDEMDLVQLLNAELGAGITGEEDIGLTVILTEGFGRLPLSDDIFSAIEPYDGRMVSMNGRTQVRAGAQRPEILIPADEAPADIGRSAFSIADGEPRPGQLVRIISKPYLGAYGDVEEVIPISVRYETETELASVRVRLRDGERVVVPVANVEVLAGESDE